MNVNKLFEPLSAWDEKLIQERRTYYRSLQNSDNRESAEAYARFNALYDAKITQWAVFDEDKNAYSSEPASRALTLMYVLSCPITIPKKHALRNLRRFLDDEIYMRLIEHCWVQKYKLTDEVLYAESFSWEKYHLFQDGTSIEINLRNVMPRVYRALGYHAPEGALFHFAIGVLSSLFNQTGIKTASGKVELVASPPRKGIDDIYGDIAGFLCSRDILSCARSCKAVLRSGELLRDEFLTGAGRYAKECDEEHGPQRKRIRV